MLTLRCTKKLRDRLPTSLFASASTASLTSNSTDQPNGTTTNALTNAPTNALGDWYATVLYTRPHHLILSISERSRLCVLVSAREPAFLLPRWRAAVERVLQGIGAPADSVA